MGRYARRLQKLLIHNVLHADDTPHQVSLGVAIAMLVTFLPLVGLQTIISVGLAALFRANKAICIPIVWITNPFTIVPIYGLCLALGRAVMPSGGQSETGVLMAIQQQSETAGFLPFDGWREALTWFVSLGTELWVGCGIVGLVAAVASYGLARWGVVHYRERRRLKMLRRELFRSRKQATNVACRQKVSG